MSSDWPETATPGFAKTSTPMGDPMNFTFAPTKKPQDRNGSDSSTNNMNGASCEQGPITAVFNMLKNVLLGTNNSKTDTFDFTKQAQKNKVNDDI